MTLPLGTHFLPEDQHSISQEQTGNTRRYPAWKSGRLTSWMREHIDWPYPDKQTKLKLMAELDMNKDQLKNWCTNWRKRNRWGPETQLKHHISVEQYTTTETRKHKRDRRYT